MRIVETDCGAVGVAGMPDAPDPPPARWRELVDACAAMGAAAPVTTYSVPENARAVHFATWLRPFLAGHVLDLGCGAAPVPVYLDGYPPELVTGIDPHPAPHPFAFREGVAESLPWPDRWFDVVVCATSLDHCYDPERALAEAARVLVRGGRLILWETLVPEGMGATGDTYHAFHLTPSRLAAALAAAGLVEECAVRNRADLPADVYAVFVKPADSTDAEVAR